MNQKFFPKPPPADPLPLEVWLRDTDRAEVGREPFFKGRDSEYRIFQNAVSNLKAGRVGGGTMIFQGAPGAGKTALMMECMEAVRQHSTLDEPWVAVSVNPGSLEFPGTVVSTIVTAINTENNRLLEHLPDTRTRWLKKVLNEGEKLLHEMTSWNISVEGISLSKKEHAASAQQLFIHASSFLKNYHIVVFVDEAQNTPNTFSVRDVLDCLHRDTQGIPLITAFFGLSDTESMLVKRGLSRPARRRVFSLEMLSEDDAKCAIQSVFDVYGFNGSGHEDWIDALAGLSQNWPQHISSVSFAAGQVIRDHGGKLNRGLLSKVLHLGQEMKEEYYASRLRACTQDLSVYKRIAIALNEQTDGTLSRSKLRRLTAPLLQNSTTFDDFLSNALHVGILEEKPKVPQYFRIPIPSFGDYLRALLDD